MSGITNYTEILKKSRPYVCVHVDSKDAGERMHDRGIPPWPFIKGATGAQVRFYESIIGNFMACDDRIETNLLQLFAHPEKSEWFSIISGIVFYFNVVPEQKQI